MWFALHFLCFFSVLLAFIVSSYHNREWCRITDYKTKHTLECRADNYACNLGYMIDYQIIIPHHPKERENSPKIRKLLLNLRNQNQISDSHKEVLTTR